MTTAYLYFVGYDAEETLDGMVFDSYEAAEDYNLENNEEFNIYRAVVEVKRF